MIDAAQIILNLVPALGFQSLADLEASDWLQDVELYQWADEASQRLAHQAGVFAEWDNSATAVSLTSVYPAPVNFVNLVALYYAGAKLRETNVAELAALDANWPATGGTPIRASIDAGNLGTFTLYPMPTSSGAVILALFDKYLPTISAAASALPISSPAQDYFAYHMLAEARGKESEASMPDMAQHFRKRVQMFEEIFAKYYGGGQ